MKVKYVLFALIAVFFIFALTNVVSASDNDTIFVNDTSEDISTPDVDISQSYEPSTVSKGDMVNVYVDVKNNGNEAIHNLTIFYKIPKEFNLLIFPAEYNDGKFIIDNIVPGEILRYTFICQALVSNVTAIFEASLDGSSFIPLNIYVQPENVNNESNQSDINGSTSQIVNNAPIGLNSAGNPFALLILGLLLIPLSIYKKH
ncbi:hypothetical protein [Methanobrevibacter sp.]|uniref:hypothetical protein n=1 Tax=Methanobrevibacter sp. TaxID=66852 RepID=UPI00388F9ECD